MAQTIRFEFATNPVVVSAAVLNTVNDLAQLTESDVRITDDGSSNVKVYVGPLNKELVRHWVYTDGRVILTEHDTNATHIEGSWVANWASTAP